MKSTGMIRKLDELGRIVIPKEMRNSLNIEEKDSIWIIVSGDTVILEKIEKNCILCNSTNKLIKYKDKLICQKCIEMLKTVQ